MVLVMSHRPHLEHTGQVALVQNTQASDSHTHIPNA